MPIFRYLIIHIISKNILFKVSSLDDAQIVLAQKIKKGAIMLSETKLSQVVSDLLLKKEELETEIEQLERILNRTKSYSDIYTHVITYGKSQKEKIAHWEKKLYFYFQKPTLTLAEVANFINIDELHLTELVEDNNVAFDFHYFPSSPTGDRYFVTLEALATLMANFDSVS